MLNTTAITLTPAQWHAILKPPFPLDSFTATHVRDVRTVLYRSWQRLGWLPKRHSLRCTGLTDIDLHNTSPTCNTFMITVKAGPLRLASDHISITDFASVNRTPGEPVVRTVLGRILQERNVVLAKLASTAVGYSLVDYADHLGITARHLNPDVHDMASDHASRLNDAGLSAQIRYLVDGLGHTAVHQLLTFRASTLEGEPSNVTVATSQAVADAR